VATYLLVSLHRLLQSKAIGKLALRGIGIHIIMLVLGALLSVASSLLSLEIITPASSAWVETTALKTSLTLTLQLSAIQTGLARIIIPVILITIGIAVILNFFPWARVQVVAVATRANKLLFAGLHYLFMALPLSVTCLAMIITTRNGALLVGVAGFYIIGVCAILGVAIIIQYVAIVFFGHTSLKNFFRALLPAQFVAASTCSSLATLPALLVSVKRMGIPDEIAGSAVPVFISFFRVNLMVANPFSFFLLSHLYNLPIDLPNVIFFLGMMMITSFGSPGLPQTGNVYSLPVFLAAGIPLEGVVLLKALDAIPDVFKTILNVTETAAVTSVTVRFATRTEVATHLQTETPV
jgi:Na+/H+-dicarboxylate symporter